VVTDATLEEASADQASITLPVEQEAQFAKLFEALDGSMAELVRLHHPRPTALSAPPAPPAPPALLASPAPC
jgi:hypothetical protein